MASKVKAGSILGRLGRILAENGVSTNSGESLGQWWLSNPHSFTVGALAAIHRLTNPTPNPMAQATPKRRTAIMETPTERELRSRYCTVDSCGSRFGLHAGVRTWGRKFHVRRHKGHVVPTCGAYLKLLRYFNVIEQAGHHPPPRHMLVSACGRFWGRECEAPEPNEAHPSCFSVSWSVRQFCERAVHPALDVVEKELLARNEVNATLETRPCRM
jgi:hypothetical protein